MYRQRRDEDVIEQSSGKVFPKVVPVYACMGECMQKDFARYEGAGFEVKRRRGARYIAHFYRV